MSPAGLAASIVDGLMKASPTLLYLFFGRKAILSSAQSWQSILYPPIFSFFIDTSLAWLFDWHSLNISSSQKVAAYAHLYSYASVKSVVHWFQIMRNGEFVMFDDDVGYLTPSTPSKLKKGRRNNYYRPARFPTRNIVTPIVLMYGDTDSLVDIDVMLSQLPQHTQKSNVSVKRLRGYEHLDVIWGKNVHKDVIPHVLTELGKYCGRRANGDELNGAENDSDVEDSVKVVGGAEESVSAIGDGTDFTDHEG